MKINTMLLLLKCVFCIAQNVESSTGKFRDKAQFNHISKHWSTITEYKSGIGKYVKFYPIEVINLKTKINALQFDMYIKKSEIYKTTSKIIAIDEVIRFIESNGPNLDLKIKEKSTEYIFKAKKMAFSYLVDEKE